MDYRNKPIGERIKSEYKKLGYNQDTFAHIMGVTRQTVGKWGKGESLPSINQLITMCKEFEEVPIPASDEQSLDKVRERLMQLAVKSSTHTYTVKLFNCEIGYLLCEEGYENKTRKTTDICKATGLSEDAANALINEPFRGFYDTFIKMTFAQIKEPKEYFSVPTCLYADFLELKQIHQLKKIYEDGIDPALQSLFFSAYGHYKMKKASISGLFTHEAEKLTFRQALESMLKVKYKVSETTPKGAEPDNSEFEEFILSCFCKKSALVQLQINPTFEEYILNSSDYIISFVECFAEPVFQYFERTCENATLLENKLQNQFMNIIRYMLENVELTHKKGR